jgi:Flp pilus assembly protein TadG
MPAVARLGPTRLRRPSPLPRPTRHGRGAPCWCSQAGDRGSASLEIAILAPALLLLTFVVVQAGLWFYARNLALAAAQEGVTAGRAYNAPTTAGPVRARAFLSEQAGDSLTGTTVSSTGTTAAVVRITVTGHSLSVLPGLSGMAITQSAQGSREHFTVPGGQP